MQRIVCKIPSSFRSSDTEIKIYDDQNNLFYFHPNKERKITFNLPTGEFFTNNSLLQIPFKPYAEKQNIFDKILFKRKNIKFRKPKFKYPFSEFKGRVGVNENKATITPKKRDILFDSSVVYHKFKPVPVYIACHEAYHLVVGGNRYNNKGEIIFDAESECDKFARNYMLTHGYNPSQISLVEKLMLSDPHRSCAMSKEINKQNFRR